MMSKTIEDLETDGASIVLLGTDVRNAQARSTSNDMQNTEFVVDLSMTEEGAKKFADATSKAFQNGESIGI